MINSLTSLRFFFAFFVFLSHLGGIKTNNVLFNWLQRNIFFEGYLGVSFFFILSGFVLSYSSKEKVILNNFKILAFYKARLFRIYPLYMLTTLFGALLLKSNLEIKIWIINIFALQSFFPNYEDYFINAPSWSISDEFFFYLCFPLIFPLILKFKNIGLIIIVSLVILLFSIYSFYPFFSEKFVFYINPISRLLDFSLGIYLFTLFNKFRNLKYNFVKSSLIELLAILTFLFFFLPHNLFPRMYRFSIYYWIPMFMIIFTFSIFKGIISNVLNNRLLVYLGEISFSFYLIHLSIIGIVLPICSNMNPFLIILILLMICILLSTILYEFFEKPVNNYLKQKFL